MDTPLTLEMLLHAFARYNTLLWPWNWLVVLLAVVAMLLVFRRSAGGSKLISAILGIVWVWVGIGFFMVSFAPAYPLAYAFGGAFVIQGMAFFHAAGRGLLQYAWRADYHGVIGLALALFGLVLYPFTGFLAGAAYPQIPLIGAPCPLAIFTFGLLLLTTSKVPVPLLVIPFFWAVGAVVPIAAGMSSDLVLLVGGVLASVIIVWRDRGRIE
jgi:hypothetical protein